MNECLNLISIFIDKKTNPAWTVFWEIFPDVVMEQVTILVSAILLREERDSV